MQHDVSYSVTLCFIMLLLDFRVRMMQMCAYCLDNTLFRLRIQNETRFVLVVLSNSNSNAV
jgi:hypothetical protein